MNPAVAAKLKEWKRSPLQFAIECVGMIPSDQQAIALKEFPTVKRMSIRSGHGTGKDALAAVLILWFLTTRPYPKVVTTAPTARQLSDILWAELSKWLRKSMVAEEFVLQKDKLFHKDAPKEWWCRAVSSSARASKEEQAETLAGFHGEHILVIVDEASGVVDPIYIPLEGILTQEDNKVLLIGNMTKNSGYFYDSHFHVKIAPAWRRLHWDSRESSNVADEYPEYMANKYGIDSNVFRIRVEGNPPLEDARTLIPLDWAIQCIGNEVEVAEDEPHYLGVDVARYGEDFSIILPRTGLKIFPWETFQGMNTISLGGFINQTYIEEDADGIAIDEIGVGAGVTDWLQKHGHVNCFGVNVATVSSNREEYDRLRDELWVAMKDKCMRKQYSFPDTDQGQELCNELASPFYDFNNLGGYIVESKKRMKIRGVVSPNIADALGLTEYFHNIAYKVWGKSSTAKKKKKTSQRLTRNNWMVA